MAKKKRVAAGEIGINMTPMIDCTFQLIIFFILTTQFARQEYAQLELPFPLKPRVLSEDVSQEPGPGDLVVNLVSRGEVRPGGALVSAGGEDTRLDHYYVMFDKPHRLAPTEGARLLEILMDAKKQAEEKGVKPEDFTVYLRADQRLKSRHVDEVQRLASQAGIKKMDIAAQRDQ